MRVLQIIPELETGGAERTTIDVAHALVDAGHEALVVSEGGRMVSELPGRAEHILMSAASKNPITMARNAVRLQKTIRERQVDLVHARSRAPAWSARFATRWTRRPFVTTYHGDYKAGGRLKLAYNAVMASGDAVIANSAFTAGRITEQFGFARDAIHIIPRGTDLSAFDGSARPYDWGLSEGSKAVVQIARLTDWKGQRIAIEALTHLPETVHLILAGDDQGRSDYSDGLWHLSYDLNVSERVHLVGHVDSARALAAAQVCIVPSTRAEAFGRAAVEAQAAGVPVVVSELGAVTETVLAPPQVEDDERTGWHVPPGDASALAEGITTALDLEGEQLSAHLSRARDHVHAKYSLKTMTDATLAVYAEVLAKSPPPQRR